MVNFFLLNPSDTALGVLPQMLQTLPDSHSEYEIIRLVQDEFHPSLRTIVSCRLLMEEVQMEERVSEMEHSLLAEIERLQNEVESAKQGAELVCHTADNLRTEVANLESAITEKKRQVERLVADMKEANLQSLAVLPPEDQKMLLEGTNL